MMITNSTDETVDVTVKSGTMTTEEYYIYSLVGAEYADASFHFTGLFSDHPVVLMDEGRCPEHAQQMTQEQRSAWLDGYNEWVRVLVSESNK